MKPTKEQLADPKWWDDNAKPEDKYCYQCERSGGYFFSNILEYGLPKYTVIADRPEPEWVPEVGGECLWFSPNANCWTHTKVIAYNDSMTSAWLEGEGVVAVNSSYSQFRPIKTQREELIDIVHQRGLAKNKAGAAADAILTRFDLTGKDDN